jgi:hypothetical protein
MARRKSTKRSRNEKIWIVLGFMVALSMVLALILPALK